MECLDLCIQWKRGREALEIVFIDVTTFRLQEKLVRIIVRKYSEFVFDTRTIPWTTSCDQSVQERGVLESGTKDFVDFLICVKDEARHLGIISLNGRRDIQIRKPFRFWISKLRKKS